MNSTSNYLLGLKPQPALFSTTQSPPIQQLIPCPETFQDAQMPKTLPTI